MTERQTPEQKKEEERKYFEWRNKEEAQIKELKEKKAEVSRLEVLASAVPGSARPPLGNLVKIGRLKSGVVRFYLGGGVKYESTENAPSDDLFRKIEAFYQLHTIPCTK